MKAVLKQPIEKIEQNVKDSIFYRVEEVDVDSITTAINQNFVKTKIKVNIVVQKQFYSQEKIIKTVDKTIVIPLSSILFFFDDEAEKKVDNYVHFNKYRQTEKKVVPRPRYEANK